MEWRLFTEKLNCFESLVEKETDNFRIIKIIKVFTVYIKNLRIINKTIEIQGRKQSRGKGNEIKLD